MRRPHRHPTFVIGLVVTLALIVTAAVSFVYTPVDPLRMAPGERLLGPSSGHPFGTDQYGRDLLSRVMAGARTSIAVGVIAVGIGAGLGVLLGLLSGWLGGWLDELFMRLVDAVQGFPAILSALLFSAVFSPGIVMSMVAIGVAFVPAFARLTRGSVLELRAREFVVAAGALGAADRRLLLRHILPNTLPPLFIQVSLTVAAAIIAEASLSFLGLGQQPPAPSWGSMLNAAQRYLSQAPWMALYPGLMIFGIVMALNVLGDGLRDALDPRYQ
jgi:peptide/nickel transport system permease protein